MVLFVSLFSYLSAPHLYNSKKLVANIKNRLSENLNLDFNLSNNYPIVYGISSIFLALISGKISERRRAVPNGSASCFG